MTKVFFEAMIGGDTFFIMCENGFNNNSNWSKYIAFINTHYCASVAGDSIDEYYGAIDGDARRCPFYKPEDVDESRVITLDRFIECNILFHAEEEEEEEDYYECDDDDDYDNDNADYHDLDRVMRFDTNKPPKFTVGFEIEKEDSDAVCIPYSSLYYDTDWIKEKDGSLCDDYGYELVSPAFNLFSDEIDDEINSDKRLQRLINADYSNNCGGHINLASSQYSSSELLEGLSAFFPLLYAMYPNRIYGTYCGAKSKYTYVSSKEKFSALYLKNDRILEFRIFRAVRNVENLLWRRDLMRIMCENINSSEIDVIKMICNPKSKLHVHLRKLYSVQSIVDKTEKYCAYSKDFNSKKISDVKAVINAIARLNKINRNNLGA